MADDPQPQGDAQDEANEQQDLTLSQDEVDALLGGGSPAPTEPADEDQQPAAEGFAQSEEELAAEAAMLAAAEAEERGEDSPLLTDDVLNRLFGESSTESTPGPASFDVEEVDLEGDDKPTRFGAAHAPAAAPKPIREGAGESVRELDLLADVVLTVCAEIGRSEMTIEDVLKLGPGSLIELDKLAGEPVELLVNDRRIARGEVVVVDDSFGVRITELGP